MSIHTNHIGKLLILGLTVLCTACVSGTKSSSTSSAPPMTTEWTWVSGSSTCCAFGSYGTLGVAAAGNVPGARYSAVSWIDGSGHLWLFGGNGLASVGGGNLNDLWKFDGANWTWVSGSNAVGAYGSYSGTLMPGARYGALSWIDSGGKLWLFGGNGLSTGGFGYLNDLWKFAGGQWNWMSGSSMINAVGVYGTIDTPASGNVPGARYGAVSWIDSAGNLWLFGGAGYASAGSPGYLNDLWKFDGTYWTWVSGSNTANASGVYGASGTAASGNVPGARYQAVSWIDGSGVLWLFGGDGYASAGFGTLNDLWKFAGGQWTWMSGSNTANASGVYGTLGIAAAGNVPGARYQAVSWIDGNGQLWLFGGLGSIGELNDLWKFAGGQWTWVSGSNTAGAPGVYGTLGVAAAGNVPGAREAAVSWTDSSGQLWLFGGNGYDSAGSAGNLNDLWRYAP